LNLCNQVVASDVSCHMRLPSEYCNLTKATILQVIYKFLNRGLYIFKSLILCKTRQLFALIICTALNMQGYVGGKYTLCCVVSIVCIILINKKIVHTCILEDLCEIDRSSYHDLIYIRLLIILWFDNFY
jgi:hypothetical protein